MNDAKVVLYNLLLELARVKASTCSFFSLKRAPNTLHTTLFNNTGLKATAKEGILPISAYGSSLYRRR